MEDREIPQGTEKEGKVIEMPKPAKLTYEQLENVAQQSYEQAKTWQQRAQELLARFNRVDLVVKLLELQVESKKGKDNIDSIFTPQQEYALRTELFDALYPPKTEGTEVVTEALPTE